jgi:hypothetical protein
MVNMRRHLWTSIALGLLAAGCGPEVLLNVTDGSDWKAFVSARGGGSPSTSDLSTIRFRDGLCDAQTLIPERTELNENHIISFLTKQGVDVRVERQRTDLVYLNVAGAGTKTPVRFRVAILKTREQAGRELHEGILQHGEGSWGVHRANLAVLGPLGSAEDDLRFAARLKLPCWGVFTIAGRDDTFMVPGAYIEP